MLLLGPYNMAYPKIGYTILYSTILYYTILYYSILYLYSIVYYNILVIIEYSIRYSNTVDSQYVTEAKGKVERWKGKKVEGWKVKR